MTKRKTPGQARPARALPPAAPADSALVQGPLPARKPMARATRITLFEREVRERLSRAALDVVFARAQILSEGQRAGRGGRSGNTEGQAGQPGQAGQAGQGSQVGQGEQADQAGQAGPGGMEGKGGYFGSTMLTIDLPSLADVLRDACDAGTAHRLAALMEMDGSLPRRIRDIAEREATRIAGAKLKDLRTHVVVRAQGAKVFVDVDVEAGL